jgi:hypothetical protein
MFVRVYVYVRMYVRTIQLCHTRTNVMSQLSEWKRAHKYVWTQLSDWTCALRTTCVLGGYTIACREGANAGQHSRYRPHTTASTATSTAGIATTTSASVSAWIRYVRT